MWDNAPLLRTIANALFAFSALAVLYGVTYYTLHLPGLFPLQSVQLSAVPQRVVAEEVSQVVRDETYGNLFTVDIDHMRQSLEKLPWVRSVTVRREFPHSLVLELEEHQALARWDNKALVNLQGEIFSVGDARFEKSEQLLPNFIGPEGASAEATQNYVDFSRQIEPLNLRVMQLALSARHAWQLRLSNGMLLELGREDIQKRLARFVAVQRTEDITSDLAGVVCRPSRMASCSIRGQRTEGMNRWKYVDLRYRNGFAVRRISNEKG